ncbi:MAG: sigma-54-dependent Fis family transcriptional regulator [Desulfobulbus propionicus]|nr:MAG: sigma-54-dependent Fis family transcriptional regulator [Desulfobulbus propionicus]
MAKDSFHNLIGRSENMQQLFSLLGKLAADDLSTVLIHGESGTGKELVAKAIHARSPRKGNNFVPVNCAAIPEDLLESELFGYTKGAFTGAASTKIGRIEYADGGTLFLDEIGDMKPILQAKLLRVLQEREFEPVGGLKPTPVDVRVIAATHRDLEAMVNQGKFREDLYYRLSVIPVIIPPLRKRREDIPLLVDHFIKELARVKKKPLQGFDLAAMQTLTTCEWRGNVRELENLVQHMTILHGGSTVSHADLPEKYRTGGRDRGSTKVAKEQAPRSGNVSGPEQLMLFSGPAARSQEVWSDDGVDFNDLVNDFETQLIVQALKTTKGNKKEAARILNLKRTTLLEKIKKKELQNIWQDD